MTASTTETEFPTNKPKTENTSDNSKKIIALHEKGKNGYEIAKEVFDFTSEEAVARVAAVINEAYPEV